MMREMKDSGIEWIGKIPVDWCTKKLKYCVTCLDGRRIPLDATQRQAGPYPYWGAGKIMDYIDNYIFDDRLILLGEDGAPFFDSYRPVSHLLNEKAWVNNHIHVLKTNKTMYDIYLIYCLNSVDYHEYINGAILNKLTQGNMNNIMVPTPNIVEQRAIADYLNSCCLDIDSIIVNIQSEIDTLEKYKRSVITEAVTKGLDKDVEMKDSGIKWIKQIPKTWKIIPSKYLFHNSDERKHKNDVQLTASQKYGIISQKDYMRRESAKIVLANQGIENWKHVKPDDFIISLRSFQGGLEMSDITGCITWHYVVLRATKPIYPKFYKWLFKSSQYINALQSTCSFIRDGQDLRFSNFAKVPLFEPPLGEQKRIAEFLEKECSNLDESISLLNKQLETLAAYKKSLIYEYVTGKKEVPSSWQN
ncbi:restriction endonuclease subunit S [Megasphaera sp.]|uniref:restriction endonuclease subunit S n=1 Tax=Megasphaera sp. TaxID=2023260 RepID=UPI003F074193|nr:restriction endonuclease subunit S [Megasphaera elsdenii]